MWQEGNLPRLEAHQSPRSHQNLLHPHKPRCLHFHSRDLLPGLAGCHHHCRSAPVESCQPHCCPNLASCHHHSCRDLLPDLADGHHCCSATAESCQHHCCPNLASCRLHCRRWLPKMACHHCHHEHALRPHEASREEQSLHHSCCRFHVI